jgi:hypothetical protein
MKKSKLSLLLLLALLGGACSQTFTPVTVPLRAKGIVDFSAYKDLFFIDFICDMPAAGFAADAEVRRVFLEEIPFAAGKKIVLLEPEHWDTIRGILQRYRLAVDIQYGNSVFFQRVFQAHPRALFFTGKVKLDIKKMGVVKETRDEKGEKKNAYETMEMWEMAMQVVLIDSDGSRILWQDTFSEKSEPVPGATPQFGFNSMLARLTNKLTGALQPREVLQERFILVK